MKPYELKLIILWELSKIETECIAFSEGIIGSSDTIPDNVFDQFLELERKKFVRIASRMGYENHTVVVASADKSRLQVNAYTNKRECDIEEEVREQLDDYINSWDVFCELLKQAYKDCGLEV